MMFTPQWNLFEFRSTSVISNYQWVCGKVPVERSTKTDGLRLLLRYLLNLIWVKRRREPVTQRRYVKSWYADGLVPSDTC